MMKAQFLVGNMVSAKEVLFFEVVRFSIYYVVTFVDCVQQPRYLSRSIIFTQGRRTFQTNLSNPHRTLGILIQKPIEWRKNTYPPIPATTPSKKTPTYTWNIP